MREYLIRKWRRVMLFGLLLICGACASDSFDGESFSVDAEGVGGSTSRFSVVGDYLYIVNNTQLKAVDIKDVDDPVLTSTTDLGWGIETIFGYKDKVFIGGQTGMQIYDVAKDGSPVYLSDYQHATACDPVIANDEYAYVTTRSGWECGALRDVDLLTTLNISNIRNPYVTSTYSLSSPRGLVFFKGDLFVGQGQDGLVQFDLTDPSNPALVKTYPNIAANDMISLGNTMIITRNEGIFQFGCENDVLLQYSEL